jgi:hypothetical protein
MLNGTNVMAPCQVARGFSGGDTRANFRRGSYLRQTRTSGDEVASTRILKFVRCGAPRVARAVEEWALVQALMDGGSRGQFGVT